MKLLLYNKNFTLAAPYRGDIYLSIYFMLIINIYLSIFCRNITFFWVRKATFLQSQLICEFNPLIRPDAPGWKETFWSSTWSASADRNLFHVRTEGIRMEPGRRRFGWRQSSKKRKKNDMLLLLFCRNRHIQPERDASARRENFEPQRFDAAEALSVEDPKDSTEDRKKAAHS